MEYYKQEYFDKERALFASDGVTVEDCFFDVGESPLKESKNVFANGCFFRGKYPLWYCKNVYVRGGVLYEGARAGIWYTDGIKMTDTVIQAPKAFRRCNGVELKNVVFTNAEETLWSCDNITLENVTVSKAPYFCMNSKNIKARSLAIDGKYTFDGAENVTVTDSRLVTKDAFWNSKNVTVRDSFISSEYLGWNSEDLTFVNCTIESLQGMCYIKNLKMINCKLVRTTLAFEYSDVEAEITGNIDSVFNPKSGTIKADRIGELIIEADKTDPGKTRIICSDVAKRSDRPEWLL